MFVYILSNPAISNLIGNANVGGAPSIMSQLLLRNLLNVAFGFGGTYFFINLLIGGLQYISAGGDKDSVQKATARIKNALIGISILLSVWVIVWIVETLFSVSIRSLNIPEL